MSPGEKVFSQFWSSVKQDGIILLFVGLIIFIISLWFNAFENIYEFTQVYEDYQIDELFSAGIIIAFGLLIFSWRRWKEYEIELARRLQSEKG